MTKAEFDLLPSTGNVSCPVCGNYSTHPNGGCGCPEIPSSISTFTQHINKNHHTCHINEWSKAKILVELEMRLADLEKRHHHAIIQLDCEKPKWFNKKKIALADQYVTELNAKSWQVRYDIDLIKNLLKRR